MTGLTKFPDYRRVSFPMLNRLQWLCLVLLTASLVRPQAVWAQAPTRAFVVKLSNQVADKPISGRVLVFVTTNPQRQPINGPNWFGAEPFVAMDVDKLVPNDSVILKDEKADTFPDPISKWPEAKYRVQAILDHDFYYPSAADGPGNFFSNVVDWEPATQPRIELVLDQVVPEFQYVDTDRIKFVERKSQLLSDYFQRDVIDRAAVILPASYDSQPQQRYPVYYEITGFGGNLRAMSGRGPRERPGATDTVEFIQVMLTGECKNGHHVYANSAANGPRGDVLIQELIPYIDAQFRTIADPRARFVGGHSSGGWSSLWLQVNYPEVFGGVFSTSPDPVDFRDFQGTDLYAQPTQSVYIDSQGKRRPLARRGTTVILRYDDFCKMDQVLGRGGQMRSFDAVFSPLDSKGQPRRCWDPATGMVDPEVADYWKKYDIGIIVSENWDKLREQLSGKLHIAMGDQDTFYLEGATFKLAQRLKELGSDAEIEIVSGAGHNLPPDVFQKHKQKRIAAFLKYFDKGGSPKP